MSLIRVAVVDDHVIFSQALKTLISSFDDMYVVFSATNGLEFIDHLKIQKELPDVLLLDVRMPILDGKETIKFLARSYPDIKVIALTMEDDEDTIVHMLQYGCKGYLLKDVDPPQLREAIIQVYQGDYAYIEIVKDAMQAKKRSRFEKNKLEIHFTKREEELVQYICGTDKSYNEIAEELNLSPKTIDNIRAAIFNKLGVHSRVSAIFCARELGLV